MKLDSIKLRKFRETHKLSQAEFADSIGLSQATVCEWERKDTEIKLDYYSKLLEVYGEEINDLTKDATTINILNNNHQSKDQSNPIVGIGINVENNMPHELVLTLKQQNENLHKHLENQNKIIDNFNQHTTFLEEIIVWFKSKNKED